MWFPKGPPPLSLGPHPFAKNHFKGRTLILQHLHTNYTNHTLHHTWKTLSDLAGQTATCSSSSQTPYAKPLSGVYSHLIGPH